MRKLSVLILTVLVVCGIATTALANPNGTINPLSKRGVRATGSGHDPW